MFLLDTCVVSEGNQTRPNANVDAWLGAQDSAVLFISAVSVGEIRFGIERLSPGKKRLDLERWFDEIVLVGFAGRVVSFDLKASLFWAHLRATYPNGKLADVQLAATALAHNLTFVTRNERDFRFDGLEVVNPWRA
ncbi:MAG: type II toxin-antitoxin system VapC family toxin [Alphaproteobacteria bacterium]|nr:type II toxin-antitoxin system VapC family toxin [Alphaproteobacteria bacterium]